MSQGLLTSSLLDSFEVKFKNGQRPQLVHSLTSDGTYLYLQSTHGLYKIGSGYGGTIKGHVYASNPDFYAKPGWLGFASGSLIFKASTSCMDFSKIKTEDLTTAKVITSTSESTFSRSNVLFTDGVHVGAVGVDAHDKFIIRFLSASNLSSVENELPLKLARKSVDVFGSSVIEDGINKHQVEFVSDDETLALQAGKEFALMLTSQGRVYYTGNLTILSSILGFKNPI